jgi:hypothetical protein
MNSLVSISICILALTISAANADEVRHYSSKEAALAALTSQKPGDVKGADKPSTEEDDDVEEIPVDAPTTSHVQLNIPVAGETGQL